MAHNLWDQVTCKIVRRPQYPRGLVVYWLRGSKDVHDAEKFWDWRKLYRIRGQMQINEPTWEYQVRPSWILIPITNKDAKGWERWSSKQPELGKFSQRLQRENLEKRNTGRLSGHLVHGHAVAHVRHLEEASVLHPAWSLNLSTPFRIPRYYLVWQWSSLGLPTSRVPILCRSVFPCYC